MATDRQTRAPFILGLTGPIGCGKTSVGNILLKMGALERIDADRVVHELMVPGTEVSTRVRQVFGPTVMTAEGGVDRGALAARVFAAPEALRTLEVIVHPAVRQWVRDRINAIQGQRGVVVLDAVKLLQSELLVLCDAVWVVQCSSNVQHRRLHESRGMTKEQIADRLAAQPSFEHERVVSVIDNSGSQEDLEREVLRTWNALPATR